MTIEVKQLIIKSTLTSSSNPPQRHEASSLDLEQLREQLLEECRELIRDSLDRARER